MNKKLPQCPQPLSISPINQDYTMPALAVDTHAHVFSQNYSKYPLTAAATYYPPEAKPTQYKEMHKTLGIKRGVLIQPSVLGSDNRYMLKALATLDPDHTNYKGVAVITPDTPEEDIQLLAEQGICGIRVNIAFAGSGLGLDDIKELSQKIALYNWHLQILANIADMGDQIMELADLPTPVVIDHFGFPDLSDDQYQEPFNNMIKLLQTGRAWVKISGANRITQQPNTYDDIVPLARELIEKVPNQLVWGTDWPHVAVPDLPNTEFLLEQLFRWCNDDPELIQKILVDNPKKLYSLG